MLPPKIRCCRRHAAAPAASDKRLAKATVSFGYIAVQLYVLVYVLAEALLYCI